MKHRHGLKEGRWKVDPARAAGHNDLRLAVGVHRRICKCPLTPRFTASRINSCLLDSNSKDDDENQVIDNAEEVYRWLEVFLSYSPGGVTLKPGMEKLVTFCVSIE